MYKAALGYLIIFHNKNQVSIKNWSVLLQQSFHNVSAILAAILATISGFVKLKSYDVIQLTSKVVFVLGLQSFILIASKL